MKHFYLVVVVSLLSPVAHAGTIMWTFDASISATDSEVDPLGIDGESITMSFTLDNTATWQTNTPVLVVPVLTSDAQITGGHTIEIPNANPAAYHTFAPGTGGFLESLNSFSFVDLEIDGRFVQLLDFRGESTLRPTDGEVLQAGHLATINWRSTSGMDYPLTSPNQEYSFVGATIRVSEVPLPAISFLFASALAGLFGSTRLRGARGGT